MIRTKKKARGILWFGTIILVMLLLCQIYINDYYPTDTAAIEAFSEGYSVSRQMPEKGTVVYTPKDPIAGFIFYPGGKVEYTAYEPLMLACAEKGILCILLEMPGNLAVLDPNAAEGITEQYSKIENWYIGGHSLGGSMAANYAAKHCEELDGLILLAAYSTNDLKDTSLEVLSIYGSEDQVLNAESYEKYRENLPEDFKEVIIDGGCHAGFGMYGAQDGDGTPMISADEQIQITAIEINKFIE